MTILMLGLVIFVIYIIWKSFFAAASSGFKRIPHSDAKPFASLDGASEFMAANPGFSEQEFLSKVTKAFVDVQTADSKKSAGTLRWPTYRGGFARSWTGTAVAPWAIISETRPLLVTRPACGTGCS